MYYLSRPTPFHVNFFSYKSQFPFPISFYPKNRFRFFLKFQPLPPLLGPILLFLIASFFDKFHEFFVSNESIRDSEFMNLILLNTIFIIPPIILGRQRFPQSDLLFFNGNKFQGSYSPLIFTDFPVILFLYVFKRQLSNQN